MLMNAHPTDCLLKSSKIIKACIPLSRKYSPRHCPTPPCPALPRSGRQRAPRQHGSLQQLWAVRAEEKRKGPWWQCMERCRRRPPPLERRSRVPAPHCITPLAPAARPSTWRPPVPASFPALPAIPLPIRPWRVSSADTRRPQETAAAAVNASLSPVCRHIHGHAHGLRLRRHSLGGRRRRGQGCQLG